MCERKLSVYLSVSPLLRLRSGLGCPSENCRVLARSCVQDIVPYFVLHKKLLDK